jgi:hypothetical protein
MTLKEFTKKHISNETVGYLPKWRRVFPTQLRQDERKTNSWWGKYYFVLQEKWERIHKGDVIDTEWRDIETNYNFFEY